MQLGLSQAGSFSQSALSQARETRQMSRAATHSAEAAPSTDGRRLGSGDEGRAAEAARPPWICRSLQAADTTRRRYVVAYARFDEFVFRTGLLLSTFEAPDEAAAAYLEELWQSGDPKLWANDALASLHLYVPQARRRLLLAWAVHRT